MAGTLPKIYSKEEILNHTSPVLSATCDEPIISTPWLVASSTLKYEYSSIGSRKFLEDNKSL